MKFLYRSMPNLYFAASPPQVLDEICKTKMFVCILHCCTTSQVFSCEDRLVFAHQQLGNEDGEPNIGKITLDRSLLLQDQPTLQG